MSNFIIEIMSARNLQRLVYKTTHFLSSLSLQPCFRYSSIAPVCKLNRYPSNSDRSKTLKQRICLETSSEDPLSVTFFKKYFSLSSKGRKLIFTNYEMSLCRCDGESVVKCFMSSGSDSSDFKKDKQVQLWLRDIRDDLNKELNKKPSNETSTSNQENVEREVKNDVETENLEKLGYTTEEYIAMLKETSTKSLNVGSESTVHGEGDDGEGDDADLNSDSSSSESDSDSSSSSSSDDDDGGSDVDDENDKKSSQGVEADGSSRKINKTQTNKSDVKSSLKAKSNTSDIATSELADANFLKKDVADETGNEALHAGKYITGSENPDSVVVLLYSEEDDITENIKANGGHSTMTPDSGRMWSDVEIEDFVNIAQPEPDVAQPWEAPIPLTRGKTGVFDVEDLVMLLESLNAADIVTIRIAPELNFADYMVIVSANSNRHLRAMAEDLKWTYKRKRSHKDKPYVRVHGEGTEWCCLDLGNIVLHMFMPDVREKYDLETLWTVGPKFDPKCAEEDDPYAFSEEELPWLRDLERRNEQNSEENIERET